MSKQPPRPTKETIETYDRSAEFFRRTWSATSMQDKLTRFRGALPSDAQRVLDAGCGSGRDLCWMLERGLEVVGGDLSVALLATARQSAPGGRVVRLDLQRLPLADGSFGGAWACASLLHLPRRQLPLALAELARVLQPGGALFLGMKRGKGEGWTNTGGGRRFFTYVETDELIELVEAQGFAPNKMWRGEVWVDILARRL